MVHFYYIIRLYKGIQHIWGYVYLINNVNQNQNTRNYFSLNQVETIMHIQNHRTLNITVKKRIELLCYIFWVYYKRQNTLPTNDFFMW